MKQQKRVTKIQLLSKGYHWICRDYWYESLCGSYRIEPQLLSDFCRKHTNWRHAVQTKIPNYTVYTPTESKGFTSLKEAAAFAEHEILQRNRGIAERN